MYTIDRTIRHAGTAFADNLATIHGDRHQTYRELAGRVASAAALISSISAPGDRIALWSLNSDRFLELFFAIPAAGRVIVPHNTRWAEPELVYATEDAGARLLIADRDPGGLADSVDRVIRLDTGEYEDLIDAVDATGDSASALVSPSPDDLAGLFYTGGTTGRSKGVMLTHANLLANAIHTQLAQPMHADDRYLTMAPMFHAAGLYSALALPLVGGSNVILPGFDPAIALDAIEQQAITGAIAVPTMLAAMCETQAATPRDVSSLRWISHGASPVTLEVLRRTDRLFGCELIHLYGTTETAPLAAVFRHEETHLDGDRAKSCGQATPGVEISVVDASGGALPTGSVGEVVVRGPNVMVGYWNKPEQTADAFLDGGWYRTGDVGRLDDDGFLFLVDRAKDMIVTGGENVYCTEVEDALYTHPAVLEAAVIGIPDEKWGEAVHAVVVSRDGETVSEADLIVHCRAQIASYKVPKSVSFNAEPLPKSGPGKVLKRVLREPFWDGYESSIN
ncbi:MAG: AMP-binding protein [Ilumatobacter sp.]|uniref:class I adenylate-forming enzyme family protein n=1 Tax=Ilumatobacter sp. TaxID=1967498 RepID=UPI003C712328